MKLTWLALVSLALPGAAQTTYPCEAPAALEEFHQSLRVTGDRAETIRLAREKLAQDPGNIFLHRWYLEFAAGAEVVAEYKTLLDRHPGDPMYLFLYASALRSTQAAQAVEYMEQAVRKAPDFPFPYRTLAQVYLSGSSRDEKKAIENLKSYQRICPRNLDGYSYLRAIGDREFAGEGARTLRGLLAGRTDAAALSMYATLWNTELQTTPRAGQDAVRQRISEDLATLKKIDPANNRALAGVLREGYRLTGDARGQVETAAGSKTAAPPENSAQALADWRRAHPYPAGTDRAALKKYGKALLKSSEEWAKKYPGEFTPLHERLVALDLADGGKAELESAGEALIRYEDSRHAPVRTSVRLHVAEIWLKHDIRVSEIPALLEKVLESTDTAARAGGWGTLAEAYLKLDQPFKAREVLDRMQNWLDDDKDARASSSYSLYRAQYYERMALLAENQKNKLDALTYYERAIATRRLDPARLERAHALWKELGGSNEGWLVFSTPATAATAGIQAAAPRVTSRADIGKPLPYLHLKDFRGETWTLASFQGKTTLVNVWATWCGPCQRELPHLQKLYDKIKDQTDVQVLTLNVDEDIQKVQPYLSKYKYTFPVLLAHSYVYALLPNLSIPRNWVVDKAGAMREESIGFGGDGNQWVKNALAKLTE